MCPKCNRDYCRFYVSQQKEDAKSNSLLDINEIMDCYSNAIDYQKAYGDLLSWVDAAIVDYCTLSEILVSRGIEHENIVSGIHELITHLEATIKELEEK